mmetsp:Transcript_35431/g.88620  ORF Transcript_35431/g.88620 Transcript_35431/m.88620 type:complete len:287 (-) Transcript_35431:130-990(-)
MALGWLARRVGCRRCSHGTSVKHRPCLWSCCWRLKPSRLTLTSGRRERLPHLPPAAPPPPPPPQLFQQGRWECVRRRCLRLHRLARSLSVAATAAGFARGGANAVGRGAAPRSRRRCPERLAPSPPLPVGAEAVAVAVVSSRRRDVHSRSHCVCVVEGASPQPQIHRVAIHPPGHRDAQMQELQRRFQIPLAPRPPSRARSARPRPRTPPQRHSTAAVPAAAPSSLASRPNPGDGWSLLFQLRIRPFLLLQRLFPLPLLLSTAHSTRPRWKHRKARRVFRRRGGHL